MLNTTLNMRKKLNWGTSIFGDTFFVQCGTTIDADQH